MAGTIEGAKKATATKKKKREKREELERINKINSKKSPIRSFDRPNKNRVRNIIIPLTKEKVPYGNILTLETHKFLFAKEFGDEYNIFVVEKREGEIIKMIEKGPPSNTHVIYGDVTKIPLNMDFDVVYLDWCGKFNKEMIESCNPLFKEARILGFTFSLMREKKETLKTLKKNLRSIIGNNWVIISEERYCDSSPMITIFLERGENVSSESAQKAWETRRANAEKERLTLLSEKEKRSETAKKAWETRRKNQKFGI